MRLPPGEPKRRVVGMVSSPVVRPAAACRHWPIAVGCQHHRPSESGRHGPEHRAGSPESTVLSGPSDTHSRQQRFIAVRVCHIKRTRNQLRQMGIRQKDSIRCRWPQPRATELISRWTSHIPSLYQAECLLGRLYMRKHATVQLFGQQSDGLRPSGIAKKS